MFAHQRVERKSCSFAAVAVDGLTGIDELARALEDSDGVTLDAGVAYTGDEPVRVRVRKRSHRYDMTDEGAAVRLAGTPPGWHDVAERVVAERGFNVNRAGVVFVQGVEGRDLTALARGLADSSVAVFAALLDLSE
jgi:hypothetical protein